MSDDYWRDDPEHGYLAHQSERCPHCKSDDTVRCHYRGSPAIPECDYWLCNSCTNQWGHE